MSRYLRYQLAVRPSLSSISCTPRTSRSIARTPFGESLALWQRVALDQLALEGSRAPRRLARRRRQDVDRGLHHAIACGQMRQRDVVVEPVKEMSD